MDRNHRRHFDAIGVDVILHHHLKTEGHVIEECDQQQHHQHGGKRRAEPQDESAVAASSTRDLRGSEPKSQRHQRHRSYALHPPLPNALASGAEASRTYGRMTIALAFQPSILPLHAEADDPGGQGKAYTDGHHCPTRGVDRLEIETVAHIPKEMPNAVAEVENE
jgi:hypothetical protein